MATDHSEPPAEGTTEPRDSTQPQMVTLSLADLDEVVARVVRRERARESGPSREIPTDGDESATPRSPSQGLGQMPSAEALVGLPTSAGPAPTEAVTASQQAGAALSATALISNLLPVMGNKSGLGSPGIYVGEGLPPVPAKLAKTIRRWEFTEMSELLPEYWGFVSGAKSEEDESSQARRIPAQKKRKVTDIDTWLQCFGTYIAVMAGGSPEAVPELIAYQLFILGASQDYEGLAWVTYDAAFRRQAAATGNRQWSRVNPSLHSICFAGAAKRAVRCDLCLSRTHQTRDCALVSDPDPEMGTRLRLLEAALSALTWKQATSTSGATQARAVTSPRQYSPYGGEPEPCRKWNEKRCGYRRCRYPHVCSECGGAHPAVECPIQPLTGPLMPDPRGARGLMYPQGGLRRPPPEQPIHPRGGFGPTRGQPRAPGTGRPY